MRLKLQEKVNKLEQHLEHFSPDACHLKVNLERHPTKYWFTASLLLSLPSTTLRSAKFGEDPLPAFDQAVRALLRELKTKKASIRHEKDWQPENAVKIKGSVGATASAASRSRAAQAPPSAA